MLRVSKTCPTSMSTCISWTLEWVLSIWGTTRRWPWLFRLPGKFPLILKEKCEHVVTACHGEHPNRWRSGCAGSRGRSQTAGGRGEGRLLRGYDIQTKYPTINGILKGKEKKRMWRKDIRESISGRGENMCKDPGIRESKRYSGNKARMFSIEGKAHHLGHGTKIAYWKATIGYVWLAKTYSRGPAESVRGDDGPKALYAHVRSLKSSWVMATLIHICCNYLSLVLRLTNWFEPF